MRINRGPSADAAALAHARETVEALYRNDSRRILATLIRLLGDFDLAEEALHDAFTAALEQWSKDGVPSNPRAWLVSVGRFKGIDAMRRRTRFDVSHAALAERLDSATIDPGEWDHEGVEDDRLRLIFTCCHPALAPEARVALTLRLLGGLTVAEIAQAFLVPETTMAQRITRAKAKIKAARIPYRVPAAEDLPTQLSLPTSHPRERVIVGSDRAISTEKSVNRPHFRLTGDFSRNLKARSRLYL